MGGKDDIGQFFSAGDTTAEVLRQVRFADTDPEAERLSLLPILQEALRPGLH